MKAIEYFRDIAAEVNRFNELTHSKHETWERRTSGPNWPVLRRYVRLLKIALEQAEYIEELTAILEDEGK